MAAKQQHRPVLGETHWSRCASRVTGCYVPCRSFSGPSLYHPRLKVTPNPSLLFFGIAQGFRIFLPQKTDKSKMGENKKSAGSEKRRNLSSGSHSFLGSGVLRKQAKKAKRRKGAEKNETTNKVG